MKSVVAAFFLAFVGLIATDFSVPVGLSLIGAAVVVLVVIGVRNRPRRVVRRGQAARWEWGAAAGGLGGASATLRKLRHDSGGDSDGDGDGGGGCGGGGCGGGGGGE